MINLEMKLGSMKVSSLEYSIFDNSLQYQDANYVPSSEKVVFKLRIKNIANKNIWLTSNSALMLVPAGDSSGNPEN